MFYLEVPYSEKDKANKLGANWDGVKKKWGVPPEIDLEFFVKWIPLDKLEEARKIIDQQKPEKGIKLSNLLMTVKNAIDEKMENIYWVHAEIANLDERPSILYLQLAELDSNGKQICTSRACVLKNNLDWIKSKFHTETGQNFQKGLKVLLKVKVEYSIKYQLSLTIVDIDPTFTLGGIEAKIKKLRDQVVALNLYDKNKKLKNSEYYKKIAVVSPLDAAGLGDFKSDADGIEKNNICSFIYYTGTFQGDKTNKTVSEAIKKASFDSLKEEYDAIVVIRGGGAKTDLHFLNEFDILKACAEASIPVFVGIGHERDHVLLDEVANKSFDTPSKVIAYILNNNIEFSKNINKSYERIVVLRDKIFKQYQTEILALSESVNKSSGMELLRFKNEINTIYNKTNELAFTKKSNFKMQMEEAYSTFTMKAFTLLKRTQSDFELAYNTIENNKKNVLYNFKTDINGLISEISIKSPLNALNNGYAIIKNSKGDVLTTIEKLEENKEFIIMMQDAEKTIKLGE